VQPNAIQRLQPAQFLVYDEYPEEPFTPPRQLKTKTISLAPDEPYLLRPGDRVLGCSEERVEMPLELMGFIQTKGSLARGFLMAHMCDGQIDPGYRGKVTFEIINHSEFFYRLVPGMPFSQLFFFMLSSPHPTGYKGRYQESGAPTPMYSDR
jgi:dCTP deaminase